MAIAVDPLGRFLYTVSNTGTTVEAYNVHTDTGALSRVDHSPFAAGQMPYSVAVDPDGRSVYVGNDDADQVTVLAIDSSGELKITDHGPFTVHGLEPEMIIVKERP
jgi:6-phosphogluconolactonase